MVGAIADTHAVIWYLLDSPRLSNRAAAEFERCQTSATLIGVSSMTIICGGVSTEQQIAQARNPWITKSQRRRRSRSTKHAKACCCGDSSLRFHISQSSRLRGLNPWPSRMQAIQRRRDWRVYLPHLPERHLAEIRQQADAEVTVA